MVEYAGGLCLPAHWQRGGKRDHRADDWASEETDHPGDVAEAALAHMVKDKTEAAYRRGNLLEKRRTLMDDWAKWCGKGK